MTTILFTFILALGLSLLLTPLAKKLGIKLGAMDMPSDRKMHHSPIPRTGGLAIFVAAMVTVGLTWLLKTSVSELMVIDGKVLFFLAGAVVVFGTGLFDDFHRLGPWMKFAFQIIGASLAFAGGVNVGGFSLFGMHIHLGVLNYGLTVFWFLLFINAVNLVDGLDGRGTCGTSINK